MKTLNLFALLVSTLLLFSCGGGDDDSGPAGNSISATVTGDISANFSASGEVQGQKLVQATLASNGALAIVGTDIDGSSMSIGIPEYDGAGSYSLAITSVNSATFTSVEVNGQNFSTTGVTAISGSIEITVNGDVINGAFNFDGEGNDDIQADVSGEFSVIAEAQ